MNYNLHLTLIGQRMYSAFVFFGGLAEIFLSIMLWFVLDSDRKTTVFSDGSRVYAVASLIKSDSSLINEDCDTGDKLDLSEERMTMLNESSYIGISRMMFEQFFIEMEEPDQDWQVEDLNLFEVFGTSELIFENLD